MYKSNITTNFIVTKFLYILQFQLKSRGEGGGGGVQKTKCKTPSPNFEELTESAIIFLRGVWEKKLCGVKVWGGGGGGGVALNEFLEKNV